LKITEAEVFMVPELKLFSSSKILLVYIEGIVNRGWFAVTGPFNSFWPWNYYVFDERSKP
jgi:hypothetical protein